MRIIFIIYFSLCGFLANSQNLYHYLDSLEGNRNKDFIEIADSILKEELSKDLRAYTLTKKADFIRKFDRDSALEVYEAVELLLPQLSTDSVKGKIFLSLAVYYDLTGKTSKSIQYYLNSLTFATNPKEVIDIYYNLTYFYSERGKLDSAVFYVTKGLNLADSINATESKIKFSMLLSSQLFYQGDSIRALNVAEEALKDAIILNDSSLILRAHGNVVTKLNSNQAIKALYHTEQAIDYALAIRDFRSLGYHYLALGDIQLDLYGPELAESSYYLALKVFRSEDLIQPEAVTLARLIGLLTEAKKFKKADSIAKIVESRISMLPFTLYEKVNFYKTLRKLYAHMGAFEEALEASSKLDSIRVVQFDLEKNEAIEELITKYETKEKELAINRLKEENEQKELILSQQRIIILIILFFFLALLLIGFLLYNQFKLKKIRESELLQQRLLRVQLNPHFMFNSLNAIQSMVYEGRNKQDTADYLAKFSQLTRQILELNQHDRISIVDEISFINNYLTIQQLRFDNPFTFRVKLDGKIDIYEAYIPPMITQPFLENAIDHGISKHKLKGLIEISFQLAEDILTINILDNGVGLNNNHNTSQNKKHTSLATAITLQRLKSIKLSKSEKAKLTVENVVNGEVVLGTKVKIKLPYLTED